MMLRKKYTIATILAILGLTTAILIPISGSPSTVEHDPRADISDDGIIGDFVTASSCDTDDLTNWSAGGEAGTPTNDLNDKKEGDASINIGKSGTGSATFYYDRTISPAIDIKAELLVFWIHLARGVLDKINGATVHVYDSSGNWHGWDIKRSLKRGWSPIVMGGWGDTRSSPAGDLTDITKIRLYFLTNNASDSITVGNMKMDYWHYGRIFTITGGSEASPIDVFEECYQHDKDNALGIFEKFLGSDDRKGDAYPAVTYLVRSGAIYIDTDAWGKAENIGILNVLPHGKYPYYAAGSFVKAAQLRHMRFGKVIDEATKKTAKGVTLYINTYDAGIFARVDIYSSSIKLSSYATMYGGRIWNSQIHKMGLLTSGRVPNSTFDVYNVDFVDVQAPNHAALNHQLAGNFEKIRMLNCKNPIHVYGGGLTFKGITMSGCTYTARAENIAGETTHFINFDVDKWAFYWKGTGTGKIFREYEFDVLVEDRVTKAAISGATVTLKDKDGNQVFSVTTGADGKIATQTVKHGYFDQAHGNTEQLYAPFHLRIEKAGHATYDDYNLALDEKTALKITLSRPPALPAAVDIEPDILHFKSKRKWIEAYIELPEGYDVSNIDVSSILLNNSIPVDSDAPSEIGDHDKDGIQDLIVKFNRQDLIAILGVGEATLIITGKVNDIPFEGTDTIRVIGK